MANNKEPNARASLSQIDWLAAFPFTHLFRTFRLAIHPSKLLLGLAAVLTCYCGGRVLDLFAPNQVVVGRPTYSLPLPADEIQQYMEAPTATDFYRWRDQTRKNNKKILASLLVSHLEKKQGDAEELANKGKALEELETLLKSKRKTALGLLDKRQEKARKTIKDKLDDDERKEALKELDNAAGFLEIAIRKSSRVAMMVLKLDSNKAIETVVKLDIDEKDAKKAAKARAAVMKDRLALRKAIGLADSYDYARALRGVGVFQASLSYGILMFNCAVESVLDAKLFFNEQFTGFGTVGETAPAPGLVKTLGLAAAGLGWFVRVHWLYFTIYAVFCLAVWSIAGGAICRIAALHATRDEKIPLGEAFAFAKNKFSNFFCAPLMPVLFIAGCCLGIIIVMLPGLIPWAGPILVGPLFIVVLAISFVLALIIVGGVAGLGLMYPTIAIEGSDAFDALSRSYSYVYARPWRTMFYTLVTAIYGTLCFIFVKLFVSLVFVSAAKVGGVLANVWPSSQAAPLGKLQAMWFSPSFSGPFFGRFFQFDLSGPENIGSFFIALWVFLTVGLVIAFAISFFFSGYTLIYLLLRQRVDATEFEDAYVEEFEPEPIGPPAPAEPEVAPAAAPTEQEEPASPTTKPKAQPKVEPKVEPEKKENDKEADDKKQ